MLSLPLALQLPSTPYPIRPVQWADVPSLRACCWPERSVAQSQRVVARALRLADQHYGYGVVALSGADVVAYGQFTQWPRAAEISDLIVCEGLRGRGIGTALIQTLVQHALEHAVAQVEIGVALTNPRALALYRRLGFQDRRTVNLDMNGVRTPVLYLGLELG